MANGIIYNLFILYPYKYRVSVKTFFSIISNNIQENKIQKRLTTSRKNL